MRLATFDTPCSCFAGWGSPLQDVRLGAVPGAGLEETKSPICRDVRYQVRPSETRIDPRVIHASGVVNGRGVGTPVRTSGVRGVPTVTTLLDHRADEGEDRHGR
jgi:hypothetical protein